MESNEEALQAGLGAAAKKVVEDEMDQFKPKPVEIMNRSERKSRTKYFTKTLKEHMKRKPTFNIEENDEDKQVEGVEKLRAWATRYAILVRKLQELESKRSDTGYIEQSPEESEATEQGEGTIGAE
jgi:hypothetical protein